MEVKYGVLFCKFGPLAHGPIEQMHRELETWTALMLKKDPPADHGLRIEPYNFITHDYVDGEITERVSHLKMYSPSELYQLSNYRSENDLWKWADLFESELPIFYHHTETSEIEVRILREQDDQILATFWFRGEPFMVAHRFNCGEDASCDKFVTDAETFWMATIHLWSLNREIFAQQIDENKPDYRLTQIQDKAFNLD